MPTRKFGNASEAARAGLHLIDRRDREESAKLARLIGAVNDGIAGIERGDGIEFGSVNDLDRHIERIGKEVTARFSGKARRGKVRKATEDHPRARGTK